MLTKEDLQLLSEMMDMKLNEKLTPINEHLESIDERLYNLEEDMQEIKGMVNILSQWADAATEYHIHEIHYPLNDDEIVK